MIRLYSLELFNRIEKFDARDFCIIVVLLSILLLYEFTLHNFISIIPDKYTFFSLYPLSAGIYNKLEINLITVFNFMDISSKGYSIVSFCRFKGYLVCLGWKSYSGFVYHFVEVAPSTVINLFFQTTWVMLTPILIKSIEYITGKQSLELKICSI